MFKQLFLLTSIFIIFIASGCSKDHPQPDFAKIVSEDIAEPQSGNIREEDVEDEGISFGPENSGEEGNVSVSEGGDEDKTPGFLEPFLPRNGVNIVASLSQEEQARRQAPYSPSKNLSDMFFAFDDYDLDDQLLKTLQKNVAYLKLHPSFRIEIQGHADERGSNNYNLTLGEKRVQSVKEFLVTLGVDEGRIHSVSYGEEKPFCFENNEKCWYYNRRVRFLVSK